MANRLAQEGSPYLLQHADNPVAWYPWGDEAFARARTEEKPIFLSVGYSTCHWCHVMEHESFENDDVARVLNEHFISIKVDREERPDVDRVYMLFVQATTNSGGWPMSVWLTPELKPFFGGTYFPPESRFGRPGFVDILTEIARVWADERVKLLESADTLTRTLAETRAAAAGSGPVAGPEALAAAVAELSQSFDGTHGGFGGAPKFPRPSDLLFLFREHARTGSGLAREMGVQTLRAMAAGGMRDHLGGGFHRYSVDAAWRVPHFEKMLYDQAQLVLAYLEGGQATGDASLLDVAADTLRYVSRDMTDARGGFYSAEDADSVPPEAAADAGARKSEGAFYLWAADEVETLVDGDADVVERFYGIEPNGNAPQDPMGDFTGKNILYLQQTAAEIAKLTGRAEEDVTAAVSAARERLFEKRGERPRPHLDDKVLTAWNGLMIAAFARGARVLQDPSLRTTARAAASFVREALWRPEKGGLIRRYRDGQAAIDAYAEDHAFLIWGLLELFQSDGDAEWLRWAIALQRRQDELFWDETNGGWYATSGRDASVLLRLKEDYDGAEPSASSVGLLNLLTLTHLTGDQTVRARAEQAFGRFGTEIGRAARIIPLTLAGLAQYHAGGSQIVVVGEPDADDTGALWARVSARYLPFAVVIPVRPGHVEEISRLLPFVASMTMIDGRATAYVCTGFACQEPVTAPAALDAQLERL